MSLNLQCYNEYIVLLYVFMNQHPLSTKQSLGSNSLTPRILDLNQQTLDIFDKLIKPTRQLALA